MRYLKLLAGGLAVAYFAIGTCLVLYSIVYARTVTCTSESWTGFFWCPAMADKAFDAPIQMLLWPLYFF